MAHEIETFDLNSPGSRKSRRSLKDAKDILDVDFKYSSSELLKIESYLKLSNSIVVRLIPASELYAYKKTFTWNLASYNDHGFKLQFKFDHPKYISFGGKDTLKITIKNAEQFLQPQNERLKSVPDGYSLTLKLPP